MTHSLCKVPTKPCSLILRSLEVRCKNCTRNEGPSLLLGLTMARVRAGALSGSVRRRVGDPAMGPPFEVGIII